MYTRDKARVIFYSLMIAFPILQIAICYVAVNANMILMAFQNYEYSASGLGFDVTLSFDNFKVAFDTFINSMDMIKRSSILFLINMFIGFPFALIFSFYIYKGFAFSGFFKIILFLPQIISGLIFTMLYKYVVIDVYSSIMFTLTGVDNPGGLLDPTNPSVELTTIIVYNVWVSFGVKTLLFSGSMSGIDNSIVESAQLDGVNLYQEFIHITFPLIYGTVAQFIIIQVTSIFVDGMHIMSFYGTRGKHIATLGYFLFAEAEGSDFIASSKVNYTYGELSAFGLIITAIVLPITLGIRKMLDKLGPSAN